MDYNVCLDQIAGAWNEFVHWMLNDGQSFTYFILFSATCSALVAFSARGTEKEIAEGRVSYTKDDFVTAMEHEGYDRDIARVVYNYIQSMHGVGFPIHPKDDLYLLGITEGAILRDFPTPHNRADKKGSRVRKELNTVQDLVAYADSLPRSADYVWDMWPMELAN